MMGFCVILMNHISRCISVFTKYFIITRPFKTGLFVGCRFYGQKYVISTTILYFCFGLLVFTLTLIGERKRNAFICFMFQRRIDESDGESKWLVWSSEKLFL